MTITRAPGFARKVGGGILVGVGGAAAVGGVVEAVRALSQASDARAVPQVDTARHDRLASEARTSGLGADVLYGTALGSAAVGVVLLVTASGQAAPAPAPDKESPGGPDFESILFVPLQGGAALSLSARF